MGTCDCPYQLADQCNGSISRSLDPQRHHIRYGLLHPTWLFLLGRLPVEHKDSLFNHGSKSSGPSMFGPTLITTPHLSTPDPPFCLCCDLVSHQESSWPEINGLLSLVLISLCTLSNHDGWSNCSTDALTLCSGLSWASPQNLSHILMLASSLV